MNGDAGEQTGPLVVIHTPDEEVRDLAVGTFVLFDLVAKVVGTADLQLRRRYAVQITEQLDWLSGEAWDVQAWAEVMLLSGSSQAPDSAGPAADRDGRGPGDGP